LTEKYGMRPLSYWSEEDAIDGKAVNALTIILKGRGCSFAKRESCTMCGYNNDSPPSDMMAQDYVDQIRSILDEIDGRGYIKIFTSGSFTDPNEVPPESCENILRIIKERSPDSRILFESRPEFITHDVMNRLLSIHKDLEVALGLESAEDRVRMGLIGKRYPLGEFFRAADIVIASGARLKTYLILKPPFLSEAGSIKDVLSSIRTLSDRYPGSTVSVNPVNVQKGTMVEGLYEIGSFRPPWLWSVIEVLRSGKDIAGDRLRIVSYPTGGGKRRGAHNCGKCDPQLLEAIKRFDVSNVLEDLPSPVGCCRAEWGQSMTTSI
jgi:radical SAM enzyme (TIGR01210 family)